MLINSIPEQYKQCQSKLKSVVGLLAGGENYCKFWLQLAEMSILQHWHVDHVEAHKLCLDFSNWWLFSLRNYLHSKAGSISTVCAECISCQGGQDEVGTFGIWFGKFQGGKTKCHSRSETICPHGARIPHRPRIAKTSWCPCHFSLKLAADLNNKHCEPKSLSPQPMPLLPCSLFNLSQLTWLLCS